ncbi:hypothetical protein ACOME3_008493 [Neoechinorhynchus agilis]
METKEFWIEIGLTFSEEDIDRTLPLRRKILFEILISDHSSGEASSMTLAKDAMLSLLKTLVALKQAEEPLHEVRFLEVHHCKKSFLVRSILRGLGSMKLVAMGIGLASFECSEQSALMTVSKPEDLIQAAAALFQGKERFRFTTLHHSDEWGRYLLIILRSWAIWNLTLHGQ